jgi:hypothetical protein
LIQQIYIILKSTKFRTARTDLDKMVAYLKLLGEDQSRELYARILNPTLMTGQFGYMAQRWYSSFSVDLAYCS